jgi:hypothetical protein
VRRSDADPFEHELVQQRAERVSRYSPQRENAAEQERAGKRQAKRVERGKMNQAKPFDADGDRPAISATLSGVER